MATIPNTKALTASDGNLDYFNVDTLNKRVQIPNGATIVTYADNETTVGLQLKNGTVAPLASVTAPAIAGGGTINTVGVGISRVTPAAAVATVVLAAGTFSGQEIWIVNEGAAASTIEFDVAGTSNVANGTACMIPGLTGRHFVWDTGTSLWYCGSGDGAISSATTPDPGANGTINTAGVGIALVTPAAARTGIILQAGTINGQEIWIVNQGAAANTLTLNVTPATANVADSATETAIAGLTARKYVWISAVSLWYAARD